MVAWPPCEKAELGVLSVFTIAGFARALLFLILFIHIAMQLINFNKVFFSLVYVVSGYAVAGATHIFRIIENRPAFEMSLSCYEKLVEGYKNWTIYEVCNGSIKDMEFSLNRNGIKTTDLTTLIDFIPSQSAVSGFPIWHAIPFDDMRGAEVLCDLGSAKFQDDGDPFSVNLTFIDECLLNTRFQFSRIDEMEFTCEAEDLTPIEAGQTMIGNVSYPYYSCCEYRLGF